MNDNNEDPNKREGHLELKITKLSEFAREKGGRRLSEPVQVLGFQWRIQARSEEFGKPVGKSLGFFLQCIDIQADPVWTCLALKLSAQKQGKQDDERKFGHLFCANDDEEGYGNFVTFEKLMDPENGWYDEANDSILLSVDFEAGPPNIVSCHMARKDVVSVNGQKVKVNKHQLAAHSDYFEDIFFGRNKNSKLVVKAPANVEHFERMLDTLHPGNRPLNDDYVEGVLYLAEQFQLDEVETKCHNFLALESKHSAIFKYRLADKYGIDFLKKQILELPKEEFTKEADMFENLREYAKLDEELREELNTRIGQLFGKGKSAEEPPAKRARKST